MSLSVREMMSLARLLRIPDKMVWSDNIAPVDVNNLTVAIAFDDRVVDEIAARIGRDTTFGFLDSTFIRKLVLCVLREAADIGRGHAQDNESSFGGTPAPGAPSGADNV
jgi:hypothetical protein